MATQAFKINTSGFDTWLAGVVASLPNNVRGRVLDGIALRFIERVASEVAPGVHTPVDTGRARAGWASFADARGVPLTIGGSDRKAQAEGRALSSYRYEGGRVNFKLVIRNAVVYIMPLEYGHSQQAPGGFIRINLEALRKPMTEEAVLALRDSMARSNVRARAALRRKREA